MRVFKLKDFSEWADDVGLTDKALWNEENNS